MEEKQEPKQEEQPKQEEKKVVDPDVPNVGIPKNEYFYPKIKERKVVANIFSFLPINSLAEALKMNRFTYKLYSDPTFFSKEILKWEYSKEESKAIYDFYHKIESTTHYDEKLRHLMYPEFYEKERANAK